MYYAGASPEFQLAGTLRAVGLVGVRVAEKCSAPKCFLYGSGAARGEDRERPPPEIEKNVVEK